MRDALIENGTLYAGSEPRRRTVSIGSPFFAAARASLMVESQPAPKHASCQERLRRAVVAAVPGGTGCRQYGHFMYNFVMPLWDALHALGWDAATEPPPTVFVDCTGRNLGYWGGVRLQRAPDYVHTAARVLTAQPLRSLPDLLSPQRRPTFAHGYSLPGVMTIFKSGLGTPVSDRQLSAPSATCIDELLVGYGCANLDHYNVHLPKGHVRQFRGAFLAHVAAGELPWTPRTVGSAIGAALLMVSRSKDRRILNERAVFDRVTRIRGISRGRSRLTSFEGLPLHTQMRISAKADIMLGMDGTGLFNANWMQPGSVVVYVLPYMAATVLPSKGDNFVRLWRALGLRTFRMDVTSRNDTVVTSRLKWCVRCLQNGSLHVPPGAVNRALVPSWSGCAASRSSAFGCVLSQDSRLSLPRTARIVRAAAAEIATSSGPNPTLKGALSTVRTSNRSVRITPTRPRAGNGWRHTHSWTSIPSPRASAPLVKK